MMKPKIAILTDSSVNIKEAKCVKCVQSHDLLEFEKISLFSCVHILNLKKITTRFAKSEKVKNKTIAEGELWISPKREVTLKIKRSPIASLLLSNIALR